jgi:hypothetical protein
MLISILRIVLFTVFGVARLVAEATAFPLTPGQVLPFAGDYGPAGLFTDDGFKVDTKTGAKTPVAGFPAGGYRVAVSPNSNDLYVLVPEDSNPPFDFTDGAVWRLSLDTGVATRLPGGCTQCGSPGSADLTANPLVVKTVFGDSFHYNGVDASSDGLIAIATTGRVFVEQTGFCVPFCGPTSTNPEDFPESGWGDPINDGPKDVAWGYGHILYVSSFHNIHTFDVDANRWLGYYCQDCLDETRRITVFTPVPNPSTWWLVGVGVSIGLVALYRRRPAV